MGLVEDYFELVNYYTSKHGLKSIVLIQAGAFFEAYSITGNVIKNPQAFEVARMCELKIVPKVNHVGEGNTLYQMGFRDYQLDKYIERITDEGYTVAAIKQDEQASGTTRSVLGVYSAGTFYNSESTTLSNYITILSIDIIRSNIVFGLSSIDVYTGQLNLCEYVRPNKDDTTTYDDVERYMATYKPVEVIIAGNVDIDKVIQYTHIEHSKKIHHIQPVKIAEINTTELMKFRDTMRDMEYSYKRCANQTVQEEIIKKFYPDEDTDVFMDTMGLNEYPQAAQALTFLLEYVYSHNPDIVHKIAEPVIHREDNELILANHSLRQLNILDNGDHNGITSSVVRFVNRCITPMGKRKQYFDIIRPTRNAEWLNRQYTITQHLTDKLDIRTQLPTVDFDKVYRKIVMRKITIPDLFEFLNELRKLKAVILDDTTKSYIRDELKTEDYMKSLDTILSILNETLDETTTLSKHKYPDLYELYVKTFCSRDIVDGIVRAMSSILAKYDKKAACVLHETAKSPPYIRTTKRRYAILQEEIKKSPIVVMGITLDTTKITAEPLLNNDVKIKSPQINDLINSVAENKDIYNLALNENFQQFIKELAEYKRDFFNLTNYITILDVALNRAYMAYHYNYNRPTITTDGVVEAKQLRHLLIEHIQQTEPYVPNDITLGRDMDGMLLFGTNASGKSSLIKALGISVVLAQSGFNVPCTEFHYTPFKHIFTRILGNDNIFKNLSSYAVEMSEFRTILKYAGKDSLVLGDELCSGTEIGSALSVFSAGLIHLHNKQVKFIFATHFHQITTYHRILALSRLCFKHLKVDIDEHDNLYYDRRIHDGAGNNMYGLVVCKALGLPDEFLELANDIRLELYPDHRASISTTSRYNAKKIVSKCECCGGKAEETHHLLPQHMADERGYINIGGMVIHKNTKSNLISLCGECHHKFHEESIAHKRVKVGTTTKTVPFDEILQQFAWKPSR
jgi:DNA mismatch repair protein MutS